MTLPPGPSRSSAHLRQSPLRNPDRLPPLLHPRPATRCQPPDRSLPHCPRGCSRPHGRALCRSHHATRAGHIASHRPSRLNVNTDPGTLNPFLVVPCLTLRENTERPITLTMGTNQIHSKRPQETALCRRKDPQLQRRTIKATNKNSFVGRSRSRTHRANHRESLTAACERPLHNRLPVRWFGRARLQPCCLGLSRRGFSGCGHRPF
jgi:hypothetical protein